MSMTELQVPAEKKLSPPRCDVAHAWITVAMYAVLERESQRRRVHPDELTALILEAVLDRNIVDAVLDF